MTKFGPNDWLSGTLQADGGYSFSFTSAGTGTSSDQVQGAQARGTAVAAQPVLAGGRGMNSAPAAVTNGQVVDSWLDLNGATVVSIATNNSAAVADGLSNSVTQPKNAAGGAVTLVTYSATFNGTTWDRTRKPNSFARVASSVAAGNPAVAKASAGDLSMFWGQNGAAITYLQFYNKATAPNIGTDTPVLTYPVPALGFFSETIPNGGAYFSTGIAYALTTDAAGTTGAAAAAVTALGVIVA